MNSFSNLATNTYSKVKNNPSCMTKGRKYLSQGKKAIDRFISNRRDYKQYRSIIKEWNKLLNQNACSKIEIGKTSKSIVAANGFKKETLETLQTTEFIEAFHSFLGKKGYEVPENLEFWEHLLPRKSGLAGLSINNCIVYNPKCINTIDFRILIHETGHLEKHSPMVSLAMGRDNYLFSFGMMLKKIPFVKNFFKDHVICHLNKKEQIALRNDYKRAYKEGYFKHNPFHNLGNELVSGIKNPKKAKVAQSKFNKLVKDFRKRPEEYYMPNSQLNREEFIADYFNLAAQGFEFSPIVTAKYIEYGGPKIAEVITPEELEQLEKLRKQISKKTLKDYGFSWQV